MKWIKGILKFILGAYVLLCIALFFAQDRLIFHPQTLPEDFTFWEGEEVEISVEDGIALNCVWIKERERKGVILYWHGNKGSNRRCLRQAQTMSGNGYDILMPDYRGFGKSDGEMESEKQMLSDAQKVYDWLKERYREDQIVVVGYSLGSGPATYLAGHNDPQRLVLLAPYTSMVDMKDQLAPFIPDFLLKYPLRSRDYITQVKSPITIFHGTRDNVIPYENGRILQSIRPQLAELVTLERESHRGTIFSSRFRQYMQEIL